MPSLYERASRPSFDPDRPMLPSLAEIKKALVAAGFELYRTRGDEVHVADRVRDNLIMDSGVSVRAKGSLSVRFVARAQRSDFPSDGPASLFEKARGLGVIAEARGYAETGSATSSIQKIRPIRTTRWMSGTRSPTRRGLPPSKKRCSKSVSSSKSTRPRA